MACRRPIPARPFEGVADVHQSCVADILRATERGLFTPTEADMLIDRVRALSIALTPGRETTPGAAAGTAAAKHP